MNSEELSIIEAFRSTVQHIVSYIDLQMNDISNLQVDEVEFNKMIEEVFA